MENEKISVENKNPSIETEKNPSRENENNPFRENEKNTLCRK